MERYTIQQRVLIVKTDLGDVFRRKFADYSQFSFEKTKFVKDLQNCQNIKNCQTDQSFQNNEIVKTAKTVKSTNNCKLVENLFKPPQMR